MEYIQNTWACLVELEKQPKYDEKAIAKEGFTLYAQGVPSPRGWVGCFKWGDIHEGPDAAVWGGSECASASSSGLALVVMPCRAKASTMAS